MRPEDWCLQVIECGGRYFIETRMAFGTVSSPHYFDVGSAVVKELTAKNVGVKREFAPKCLDDIVPIGRIKDGKVQVYAEEYARIALVCGIKLAEESDGPGKVVMRIMETENNTDSQLSRCSVLGQKEKSSGSTMTSWTGSGTSPRQRISGSGTRSGAA